MRWHFLEPPTSGDTQRRRAAERQIDRWWQAFTTHADAIDDRFVSRSDFDLVRFMDEYLHAISPQLMWEYGRAVSKPGHRP